MLASVAGPLALGFDKKIHFYTYFKPLFAAIAVVAFGFIVWDEFFTQKGIWGFNSEHLQGIFIGHLPLEEILFFIFVPFACVFIYEVLMGYFPKVKVEKIGKVLAFTIALSSFVFALGNIDNWYTSSACILSFMLTGAFYFRLKADWYGNFAFAYLVALVPFIIVNGVLTGAVTAEPIVWYSAEHIMGPRIITIPVEDFFYNYDMLILVVFLYERWKKK
jgi:lycopene cyclase domain-containing protein